MGEPDRFGAAADVHELFERMDQEPNSSKDIERLLEFVLSYMYEVEVIREVWFQVWNDDTQDVSLNDFESRIYEQGL